MESPRKIKESLDLIDDALTVPRVIARLSRAYFTFPSLTTNIHHVYLKVPASISRFNYAWLVRNPDPVLQPLGLISLER